MSAGRVVVCGEALIDLVPDGTGAWRAHPGGSPTNVAVGLGRLGGGPLLLARLAADGFGRLLRSHVAAAGVDLSLAVPSAAPTTLAVVSMAEGGIADYGFYVEGAADGGWSAADLPGELPADTVAVMTSGALALAVPSFDDTVVDLLQRERGRRTLVVDPNVRPSLISDVADHRRRLDRWLGLADVVKVSEEDLTRLEPDVEPLEVARDWQRRGPRLVVVTHGPNGATGVLGDATVRRPGWPVQVVDTVGAGDAFTSGLLTALADAGRLGPAALAELTAEELDRALGFAGRVAGITCTRAGADPPSRAEVGAAPGEPAERGPAAGAL